jgi:hypothetical protein
VLAVDKDGVTQSGTVSVVGNGANVGGLVVAVETDVRIAVADN